MKKFIPIALTFAFCIAISIFLSKYYTGTDFPFFYYVANTILDPNAKNEAIYSPNIHNKYGIPEEEIRQENSFRYSILVACLLAPLAFLPYYAAKSVMIFLDIAAYITAVAIILRILKNSGRHFLYPLALSCLWIPFLNSIVHVQVNGLLLLLIATAILAVDNDRPFYSGMLIAIATLFKLFPIIIAIILGIRNWRILASCIAAMIISFLIPGSLEWLYLLSTVNPIDIPKDFYTAAYQWLAPYSLLIFAFYSGSIGIITAIVAFYSRNYDYLLLTSFGLLAAFIMMPVVEFHHLTLLILPYIYLFTSRGTQGWLTKGFLISSAIIFSSSMSGPSDVIKYLMLFLLWAFLALRLFRVIPPGYPRPCQ